MSLYRCAACGSPNVVTGTEKDGFSYSKGIAGTIVFGLPGVVAGINGNTKCVYKCPDCGLTMDHTMPPDIKIMIDMGVMSESARNNLTLMGQKIDWNTLTSRYKNIESGYADQKINEKTAKENAKAMSDSDLLKAKATATQEEFDNAVDILKSVHEPYKKGTLTKEEYDLWTKSLNTFIENCYKFFPPNRFKDLTSALEYRGYKIYLDRLFDSYIVQLYFANEGPVMRPDFTMGQMNMSKKYPFISAFLRYYGNTEILLSNGMPISAWHWEKKNLYSREVKNPYLAMVLDVSEDCALSIFGDKYYKHLINVARVVLSGSKIIIPNYMVANDKLYYCEHSRVLSPFFPIKFNDFSKAYFEKNPKAKQKLNELLKSYDKAIEEADKLAQKYNKLKIDRKNAPEEIKKANTQIGNIKYSISNMHTEISKLERKIFGKAKARARIEELHERIKKEENKIPELRKKIEEYDEIAKLTVEDIDIEFWIVIDTYSKLVIDGVAHIFHEMNYFTEWKQVE